MAERFWCSKGHRWEPTFRPDKWPPNFCTTCPVCGEPPLGPFEVTDTTRRVETILAVGLLVAGLALMLIPGALPGVFLCFGAAAFVPLILLGQWFGRQRVKTMAETAEAMHFAFVPNLALSAVRAAAPFGLWKQGHSQKAYNALQGRVGECDVMLFEYQYTTGSGKSQQTHQVAAALLFDGAAGVPDFQLAPKTFFDKIAGFFTHNSVEIEDAAEFTRRCKLTGPNESALREAFHPDLVQYLAADGRWFLEVVDGQMLAYRTGKLAPDKFPGLATDALEVRDLLRNAGRRAP